MDILEATKSAGAHGFIRRNAWPTGDVMALGSSTSTVFDHEGLPYDDSSIGSIDIVAEDWAVAKRPEFLEVAPLDVQEAR
jgi:hypothetical protein